MKEAMTTSETAAGRALYAKHALLLSDEQQTSEDRVSLHDRIALMDAIIAIEAEARAAALDAHRPGIVADEDDTDWRIVCSCGWDGPWTNAGHAAIDALRERS